MAEHGAAIEQRARTRRSPRWRSASPQRRTARSPAPRSRSKAGGRGDAEPLAARCATAAPATPPPAARSPARTAPTSLVTHAAKRQPAARSSTGEQKALLLGLVLAHADLVRARSGRPLILLLDEVAAHLDPGRRAALFERLAASGGQVWLTGTERALFDGAGEGAVSGSCVKDGTALRA